MKKTHKTLVQKLTGFLYEKVIILFLMCLITGSFASVVYAQPQKTVTGTVVDAENLPLLGVTVLVKGTTIGTITDVNGNFSLSIPNEANTLVFSFVGMETKEVTIGTQTTFNVSMTESEIGLAEVVVVGYGSQKKESVVGAIVQASSTELERRGGVMNLAQALTGQLSGVTTIQGSGYPGADDPRIIIRAQGTWNNPNPLILVDGIERRMNDIDISEVETISVLKDASATAVFGVKGSEGVILITTKRGKIGKPKITFDANTSGKMLSRTPDKLNSYDALSYRNGVLEHELPVSEASWGLITPQEILDKYRTPYATTEYPDVGGKTVRIPNYLIFPDVNWPKETVKPISWSQRVNWNITGGSQFAKYFGSISYATNSDLLISGQENNKPYKTSLSYDRFNYRTNVDFNLTRSTILSTNIAGWIGTSRSTGNVAHVYKAFYELPPNVFPVKWPTDDGSLIYGYNPFYNMHNPVQMINNYGLTKTTTNSITTDFRLTQKLDFITEGLSLQGSLSYDNQFSYSGGVSDNFSNAEFKHIDQKIVNIRPGETLWDYTLGTVKPDGVYSWKQSPVTYLAESISRTGGGSVRRLFYQLKADYVRVFGEHDLGVTALMNREEYASGNMFPRYREDWVGRITYNYAQRYLFETNAAYNGSERFGPGYRFGFFPSAAFGWMISNEEFLQRDWLDKLKIRYSIGKVGNDNYSAPRWSYQTIWALVGDRTRFGPYQSAAGYVQSPYSQYIEQTIGNPDLTWETSVKQNFGLEVALFKNRINFNADFFKDHRTDIFMSAGSRTISAVFGASPVAANLGETKTQGYELECKLQNTSSKGLYYWFSGSYTGATDEVIFMEDAPILPDYQKRAGYQIGQSRNQYTNGYIDTWDELYGSTKLKASDDIRLPGDLYVVDFNGDGGIDSYDSAPIAYPTRPEHTWSTTMGFDYKGFSVMVQFYGVYNVCRHHTWVVEPFRDDLKSIILDFVADAWTPDNLNAKYKAHRIFSTPGSFAYYAHQFLEDASFTRLKTAEIAYTFGKAPLKKLGINSLRIYANGNNLILWTGMPDDREGDIGDTYPLYRQINFGINIGF